MIRRTVANAEFQIDRWFVDQGWTAFEFQRDAWRAYLAGRSGLVHASTGTGKSYSVWLGVVEEALRERAAQVSCEAEPLTPNPSPARGEGNRKRKHR
ncbi:MAG: hypothetical protein QM775_07510 [Pirellulales bacterium]